MRIACASCQVLLHFWFRAVEHMQLLEDLHESKMADGLLLDVISSALSALLLF
jgi:hypothetical protein